MKRLSLMDSMFLLLESRETMMHVGSLLIFQIPENYPGNYFQEVLGRFRNVRQLASPFNWKLKGPVPGLDWPTWVEDKALDLDYHIRHSALPQPGTINELMTLVSRLHGSLLDRQRPLWEFHLIEGLAGNRFAMYFKMHHACIDGMGGMRLMQATLSASPNDVDFRAPWEARAKAEKPKRAPRDFKQKLEKTFLSLTQQAQSFPEIARAFWKVGQETLQASTPMLPLPFAAPKSLLNCAITGQRRLAVTSINLTELKTLGKALDATINDLVMVICAGALRQFLQDQKALPEKPLIALVPVAVRSEKTSGPDAGNQISNLWCNLATNEADPRKRLEIIKTSTQEGKTLLSELSGGAIQNYTMLLGSPAIVLNLLRMSDKLTPAFNLIISNVPGPREPLYLNGAKLDGLYPVSFLFEGQALNITVTSYLDSLDFGLIACREAFPGINRLTDYIQNAYQELQNLLK